MVKTPIRSRRASLRSSFAVAMATTGAPIGVGHRGGRGEGWPAENTMGAFAQAFAQGARAIELDVRTCAGGEIVVQ